MYFCPLLIGKYLLLTVTTGNFGFAPASAFGPPGKRAGVASGPCGPNLSPVGLSPACVGPRGPCGSVRRSSRGVLPGLLGVTVFWNGVLVICGALVICGVLV